MPKTIIQLESSQVGTISFETEYIYSRGGPEFPLLGIAIDVSLTAWLRHERNDETVLHPLSCVYIAGEFSSPEQRRVASFQEDTFLYATEQLVARSTQMAPGNTLGSPRHCQIEQARTGNLPPVSHSNP